MGHGHGGARPGAGRPRKPREQLSPGYRRRLELAEEREARLARIAERMPSPIERARFPGPPPRATGEDWHRWNDVYGPGARLLSPYGCPLAADLAIVLGIPEHDVPRDREALEELAERARELLSAEAWRAFDAGELDDEPIWGEPTLKGDHR